MDAAARLRAGIEAARAAVAAGDVDTADRLAAGLMEDAAVRGLGPPTALGLPRRLHALLLHLAKARGDAVGRAGYRLHLVPPPQTLGPLFRYSDAERRAMAAVNRLLVPRAIHQVWIGDLPVPEAAAAWARHAAALGYAYRLWREADLAGLGLPDDPVYAAMRARGDFPGAVDVARYAILAAKGGIYLDCDWYPARDNLGFHDALPMVGMTALAEETPRLTGQGSVLLGNSFIATPAGHPGLRRLRAALAQVLAALPEAPAWWSTGPLVFTLALRAGGVSLAPQGLVAGTLPRGAPLAEVEAIRAGAVASGGGLLIGWKSW